MKPLLVGESNPYGADPYYALYPEPRGATGDRLCRLVMQMSAFDYMARFDRVNLCAGKWSLPKARTRANEILNARKGGTFVLLGAKVCAAFEVKFNPFYAWMSALGTFVVLPHPSGLSRAWHDPASFERARSVLREAGVLCGVERKAAR